MAKSREEGAVGTADPELAAAVARQLRADEEARRREEQLEFDRWKQWAGLSATDKTRLAAKVRFRADWGRLPHWVCRVVQHDPDGRPGATLAEWPEVELPAHSQEEAAGRYQKLCGIRNYVTGPKGTPATVAAPTPAAATAPPTVEA